MSELTQCNYCSLQEIRAKAKHDKMKVTLMPGRTFGVSSDGSGGIRGIDVYVHPRTVDVRAMTPAQREKWWDRWFWELSDHCVC